MLRSYSSLPANGEIHSISHTSCSLDNIVAARTKGPTALVGAELRLVSRSVEQCFLEWNEYSRSGEIRLEQSMCRDF
jgi:hypothetical protein